MTKKMHIIPIRTTIHNDHDAGCLRPQRRRFIYHPVLQPDCLDAEGDAVVHDGVHVLRRTKYIHHIYFFRNISEPRVRLPAQHRLHRRTHRDDAVTEALQVRGDQMTRPARLRRKPDHRNRVHTFEEGFYFFSGWILKFFHDVPFYRVALGNA